MCEKISKYLNEVKNCSIYGLLCENHGLQIFKIISLILPNIRIFLILKKC